MSKTNLQSTTHGGGRVVSVILAGTLAFGMTPAVALTTQSLEPMQAFAAVGDWSVSLSGDNITNNAVALASGASVEVTVAVAEATADSSTPVTSNVEIKVTDPSNQETTLQTGTFTFTADEVGDYTVVATQTGVSEGDTPKSATATLTVSAATAPEASIVNLNAVNNLQLTFGTGATAQTVTKSNGAVVTIPSGSTLSSAIDTFKGSLQGATYVDANGAVKNIAKEELVLTLADNVLTVAAAENSTVCSNSTTFAYSLDYVFGNGNVTGAGNPESPVALTYNHASQTPTIEVKDPVTGATLKSDAYDVVYQVQNADTKAWSNLASAPTDAGTYRAAVTCKGYDDPTEVAYLYFDINAVVLKLAEANEGYVTISKPANVDYAGGVAVKAPSVTVTANWGTQANPNNVTLQEGTDYTAAVYAVTELNGDGTAKTIAQTPTLAKDFKEVGNYVIGITGMGNYSDAETIYSQVFKVQGVSIATADIQVANADKLIITQAMIDKKQGIAPQLKVTLNGKTLVASQDDGATGDYTVSPALDPITTPQQNILYTITGVNNYSGSTTVTVDVLRSVDCITADDSNVVINGGNPIKYGDANAQKPSVRLEYNGSLLKEGVDYSLTYGENTGAGPKAGTITIKGIGNGWGGTATVNYAINGITATLNDVQPATGVNAAVFDGTVQDPSKFVTFSGITYIDPDTKQPKTIDAADLDYTVTTNNEFKNAGDYTYTIQLTNCPYDVSSSQGATGTLKMAKANLTNLTVKSSEPYYLVTNNAQGQPQDPQPKFIATLSNGTQYELTANDLQNGVPTYANSGLTTAGNQELKNAQGEVIATLTGAGNFENTKTVKFNVYQDINNLKYAEIPAVIYNGSAQTPAFTVTNPNAGAGNTDKPVPAVTGNGNAAVTNYTVSYESNINAGTGYIVLTGTPTQGGIFAGTLKIPFTINKAAATIAVADIADVTYTGSPIQPEPKATITAGTQTVASTFAYSYANNVNAGTATVTVVPTGVGENYDVAATTKTFKINAANMSAVAYAGDTKVAVNKQPTIKLTYNGKELVAGTDYDVTETPVTSKAGKATLKVTGKGNFTGVKTIEITVEDASIPVNPDVPTTTEGWKHNSTGWWYETGEGSYVTSAWKKINGNWYYFNKSGYMMTGWQKINGTWYYLNKKGEGTEGAMVSNAWKKINGAWYSFDKNGAMRTGWYKENGIWYYLNKAGEGTEGKMVANQWKQINGSWFFFHSGGAMATSQYVGPYWVDANGYWVR